MRRLRVFIDRHLSAAPRLCRTDICTRFLSSPSRLLSAPAIRITALVAAKLAKQMKQAVSCGRESAMHEGASSSAGFFIVTPPAPPEAYCSICTLVRYISYRDIPSPSHVFQFLPKPFHVYKRPASHALVLTVNSGISLHSRNGPMCCPIPVRVSIPRPRTHRYSGSVFLGSRIPGSATMVKFDEALAPRGRQRNSATSIRR